MAYRTVAEREAQFEAEMARYLPEDNSGFAGGFISGHNSVGSWFTSGLSGILASKGASDSSQKKWYVQRNGIQFGKNELDKAIAEYEELAKHRKLTELESTDLKEMVNRNTILTRDLQHVYDTKGGDLDAVIDKDGKSFNQRWGVDTEDEAALGALIELFKQNPSYVGGVFTAEIIKDLPITLLALLASPFTGGSSGAAQGGKIVATTLNKLNNIQPAALRGLAKVGTGVAGGSAIGAGYEAAYSKLNQGSVKGNQVKAGAAFGAGFGVLAGLGILGRTSKDLKAKQAQELQIKRGKAGGDRIDYKSMVQEAQKKTPTEPATKEFASEAVDALYPAQEINRVKKAAHKIYTEHDTRIFPELKDGVEYRVVTLAQAKAAKLPNVRDDVPVQSIVKDNVSHIVWQEGKISKEFKDFYKNYENILGESFKDITPSQHLFLRDENSYRSYLMAAELAKVKQRLKPEPQARTADEAISMKENDANDMALNELERAYEQVEAEGMTTSNRQVDELVEELKASRTTPDDIDVNTTPSIVNRGMTWLEDNPRKKLGIAAGLAGGAYAVADKEEEEPLQQALAVGLGVALGPKGYKLLKGKTINTTTARIKAQIAEGLEIDAEQAKVWETQAQVIISQLDKFTDAQVRTIINSIEGVDSASINITSDMRKARNEIKQLLDEIGKQAVDSGLIANKDGVMKLSMKGMDSSSRGAFLNNYFPHLFRNMDKLTDDDLTIILGKLNDGSATKRNIEGTLADIQDMIDSGRLTTGLTLLSPKEAINVYIQGMSRAIIGRNALNSMEKMDLGFAPNRNDISLPALLKEADFELLKGAGKLSDQEMTHYRTFDHPALKGYLAHNNIHHVLDDFFAIRHRGNIGDMAERVLKLNNALKRVFVFGSLFHAQALLMSGVYSLGLAGALKGAFKVGRNKITKDVTWADMQLGETKFIDLAKEAIADGLQIVNIKRQELVNPGKAQIDAFLPKLGRGGDIMMGAFNKIDTVTWEYLHDRFKLAVYLKQKEKMLDAGIEPKLAGQKASEFANDAFGSLDWNNFATRLYRYAAKNPNRLRSKAANRLAQLIPVNKRRWLNLGLFAPDWTVSNIRIVYKTMTGFPNMSKAVAKRIQKGNWDFDPEAKAAVKAWNAYAAYSVKAGMYTSAMWWALTSMFSDEEATMENLWDFWSSENSGRLDLGNGETMVISKQIAEPIHWAQHPMHTFMNKTSVVPKTALELMFNKQWFSLKQGMPLGPRLVDEDGTQHYAKWILGKTIPIVGKSVLDEDLDWQERFERTFTGFFGFPQYGDPEDNRR
jgi:DNA-binding transcriptional regulator YhcF (GntR family)